MALPNFFEPKIQILVDLNSFYISFGAPASLILLVVSFAFMLLWLRLQNYKKNTYGKIPSCGFIPDFWIWRILKNWGFSLTLLELLVKSQMLNRPSCLTLRKNCTSQSVYLYMHKFSPWESEKISGNCLIPKDSLSENLFVWDLFLCLEYKVWDSLGQCIKYVEFQVTVLRKSNVDQDTSHWT